MSDVTGTTAAPQPGETDRPEETAGSGSAPPIEPTTGAPVGAVPQRVPQRAPGDSRTEPEPGDPGRARGPEPAQAPAADGDDFWLPIEEVNWDGTPVRPDDPTASGRPRTVRAVDRRRLRAGASPWPGISGLVLLALAATFFAWVSVEPLWLALGHGERGTAVVSECSGSGLTLHCRGTFTGADGSVTARDVTLTGVAPGHRGRGARVPARMVGADSPKAYVDAGSLVGQLRWSLGLAMVLLCGVGIVRATGAAQLPEGLPRRGAALLGLAGPVLVTLGFLAASF